MSYLLTATVLDRLGTHLQASISALICRSIWCHPQISACSLPALLSIPLLSCTFDSTPCSGLPPIGGSIWLPCGLNQQQVMAIYVAVNPRTCGSSPYTLLIILMIRLRFSGIRKYYRIIGRKLTFEWCVSRMLLDSESRWFILMYPTFVHGAPTFWRFSTFPGVNLVLPRI